MDLEKRFAWDDREPGANDKRALNFGPHNYRAEATSVAVSSSDRLEDIWFWLRSDLYPNFASAHCFITPVAGAPVLNAQSVRFIDRTHQRQQFEYHYLFCLFRQDAPVLPVRNSSLVNERGCEPKLENKRWA